MSFPRNVSVSCQTDRTGSSKHRGRKQRKSSAAVIAEFLEKCDQDDIKKIYDEFNDSSDDDEDLYENIKLQKGIIESVRYQPWRMEKKLTLISFAKSYVEKHEGQLSRGRGYQEKGARVWRHLRRLITDTIASLTPWEVRVKAIESHFGTVVASYFLFLRWLIWINVVLTLLQVSFVIFPELIVGNAHGSLGRKSVPTSEQGTAEELETIWDAEGIVKYSVMFYGYYGSERVIGRGYRLPLAYLVTGFATFAISFIVVLRKMASNSRMSRLSNKDEQFTFSWRMFCSWDFTIGNTETANTKVASIATTFREAILEEKEKEKSVNKYRLLALRVVANVCVLLMLGASTYAIQLCVERSRQLDIRKRRGHVVTGFWQENELTLVMTIISTVFPNFFDLFAVLEKYHPRVTLRWQLARIFALNLLNLYTLFIALFWKQQDMKRELEEKLINSSFTRCDQTSSILPMNVTVHPVTLGNIPQSATVDYNASLCGGAEELAADLCWETMIGQEVVKLTLMDLVVVVGQIVVQDYLRGLFVRYCNNMCCWDMEKQFPEYADFKTAENLLHLVNNQGVVWLGIFFAPGLAVLNLLKLLVLVYVRSWSVMVCNVPQEAIFRSSRSNNFYYALLLVMLFLTMLPPLFAIVALEPSPHCGPFSGQQQILSTLTDTIEQDLPSVAGTILEYTSSPVVIVPLFMLLGMLIYYLTIVSQSLRDANKQLRIALEYERTEGKRKIYAMADATWKLKSDGQSTNSTPGISGQSGPKVGPRRNQGGLGNAAMSVLAATRVAKMLSAGRTSKVGPLKAGNVYKPPKGSPDRAGTSKVGPRQTSKAERKGIGSLQATSDTRSDSRTELRNTALKVAKITQPKASSDRVITATVEKQNVTEGNTRAPVETHNVTEGNTRAPVETHNVIEGNTRAPVETHNVTQGNTRVPVETHNVTQGNTRAPVETHNVTQGNIRVPVETHGNTRVPVETHNVTQGNISVPVETHNVIQGNTRVPVESHGNTRVPVETHNVTQGNTRVPVEAHNVTQGNTRVPVETHGNTRVPVETHNVTQGNTRVPVETHNVTQGNTRVPVETHNVTQGNTRVPVETHNVTQGNTRVPVETHGNTRVPVETHNVTQGNTRVPVEIHNVTQGNTRVPVETHNVTQGNAKVAIVQATRKFRKVTLKKESQQTSEDPQPVFRMNDIEPITEEGVLETTNTRVESDNNDSLDYDVRDRGRYGNYQQN